MSLMTVELTGTTILGYRIEELVGEGGMASVWRAKHKTLGHSVAIKIMDPAIARDKNLVERFVDEAKIQIKLQHTGIVRMENFSEDPMAMVMEYVPGRPLSQVIGREVGPIPLARALPMMRQILDAVGYAHEKGVVHRDLKPSNIIVTEDNTIKVMDFGIAKVLGSSGRTRTGASMGTPAYMAPEQITHAKDADKRADIYALGITFYEMLSGRTPFEAGGDTDSEFGLMESQVHKPPPDPREFYPAIPEAVVTVLNEALAKEPNGRFPNISALKKALEGAVDGQDGDNVKEPKSAPAKATIIEQSPPLEKATAPKEPVAIPSATPKNAPAPWIYIVGGVSVLLLIVVVVVVMVSKKGGTSEQGQDDIAETAQAPRVEDNEVKTKRYMSGNYTVAQVPAKIAEGILIESAMDAYKRNVHIYNE